MVIRDRLRAWLSGGRNDRHDLGVICRGGSESRRWSISARIWRRKGRWTLSLVLDDEPVGAAEGEAERWNLRLPTSSLEGLVACLDEALQAIEHGCAARDDPGARVALSLMRVEQHDLVCSWPALGEEGEAAGERLPDLHLLKHQLDGRCCLFFFGYGAEGGLWPPELAGALANELPRARRIALLES